ncbi:MAG: AEC family transporter [Clostridia bacterium]|nr:AEC family transporter [Clostridia bacterium]
MMMTFFAGLPNVAGFEYFARAASQILMIFIYIAVGFAFRRLKLLPENTAKTLSLMETMIFLPALLFHNLSSNVRIEKITTYSTVLIGGCVFLVFVLLVAFAFAKLFAKGEYKEEYGTYMYMFAFANYGYVGYPLIEGVFGANMLTSMILFAVPFSFAIYTYGAILLSNEKSKKFKLPPKMIPILCALALGVIVGLSGVTLPPFVTGVTASLKSCMSPVAMLMTGFVLGSLRIKQIFTSARAYAVSLVRLVAIPAIFFGALLAVNSFVALPPELLVIPMIVVSMPLGLNVIIFAEASGRDSTENARMCLISYLLSLITVPLILAILSGYLA